MTCVYLPELLPIVFVHASDLIKDFALFLVCIFCCKVRCEDLFGGSLNTVLLLDYVKKWQCQERT